LITVSHSLQRAQYGEQPVWMGAVLAAMLGQIGLPGGGYNYALGALGHTGRRPHGLPIPTLPQGKNGVSDFIPVARISDMLLIRDSRSNTTAARCATPISSWSIGRAATRSIITRTSTGCAALSTCPQTIVVHESAWTPMAKFADIVLPATMTLERDDIGAAATDPRLVAMRRAVDPIGEARDDFDIFAALSRRWASNRLLRKDATAGNGWPIFTSRHGARLPMPAAMRPDFEEFWRRGELALPSAPDDGGFCAPSATIPTRTSCRRQAARSRSIRKPSQASVTTIARPTRPGCPRPNRRIRATR
jgi:biotin/methionine sulfoxide reductase